MSGQSICMLKDQGKVRIKNSRCDCLALSSLSASMQVGWRGASPSHPSPNLSPSPSPSSRTAPRALIPPVMDQGKGPPLLGRGSGEAMLSGGGHGDRWGGSDTAGAGGGSTLLLQPSFSAGSLQRWHGWRLPEQGMPAETESVWREGDGEQKHPAGTESQDAMNIAGKEGTGQAAAPPGNECTAGGGAGPACRTQEGGSPEGTKGTPRSEGLDQNAAVASSGLWGPMHELGICVGAGSRDMPFTQWGPTITHEPGVGAQVAEEEVRELARGKEVVDSVMTMPVGVGVWGQGVGHRGQGAGCSRQRVMRQGTSQGG